MSDLFRLTRDDDRLQVDFMATIHGVRSYAGVRDRAADVTVDGVVVRVASLDDIIASKRAESSRALDDLIRRWQALPPGKRTNFLRKRVGICRTAL